MHPDDMCFQQKVEDNRIKLRISVGLAEKDPQRNALLTKAIQRVRRSESEHSNCSDISYRQNIIFIHLFTHLPCITGI